MVPERLKLAESLGAVTVNPKEVDPADVVLDSTEWRGADLVVDAVGHESALAAAFPLVRMGGTISMPGMYVEDAAPMPIGEMWLKNITLCAGVANVQAHMDEVIELIRHGRLDPKVIISHRLPLSEAAEGIRAVRSEGGLKVVLDPSSRVAVARGGEMLEGLMQNDYQLTLKHVLDRMRGPCCGRPGGDAHRRRHDARLLRRGRRARGRAARAGSSRWACKQGDRVATFMWNSQPHLELYMAAPCMGAVLHMLNIRLFEEQLTYIVNHAKDKVIFVDDSLVPLLAKVAPTFETVEQYVWSATAMRARCRTRSATRTCSRRAAGALRLSRARRAHRRGPLLHERHHRQPEGRALLAPLERPALPRAAGWPTRSASRRPTACCPVVPMFHVNAWGFPYACAMVGADLVMPGRFLQAEPLAKLIESERVTIAGAVPTIWMGLLRYADEHKPDLSSLRTRRLRRRRGARVADARVRGAPRREDHAGVGDDGDQPDRRRRAPAGGRRGRGALALPHRRPAGSCRSSTCA